jgi:ATP-dependent Clp protease adaptor protein ClpS
MPNQPTPEIHPTLNDDTLLEPLYRVIIHNDDVTPMDFVMNILRSVFLLDSVHALQVMYNAHYHGSAYIQTLPRPEAVKRIGLAQTSAQLNHYPLRFSLEPEH